MSKIVDNCVVALSFKGYYLRSINSNGFYGVTFGDYLTCRDDMGLTFYVKLNSGTFSFLTNNIIGANLIVCR